MQTGSSAKTTDGDYPSMSFPDPMSPQLEAFLDHSTSVAWMKDAEGKHVYLSKPYLDLIGVPCDEWSGKTDFDLWPDSLAARFRDLDREVLRTGQPIHFQDEESLTFPDGRKRSWWVTKFPVYDDQGNGYVGGIAVDITESKETAEALRLQHEFSDRLIESARNIVLVLDHEGRIVRFNPYLEELAGYQLDEVKGKRLADVYFEGRDREQAQDRFESALHRDQERGHVQSLISQDGDPLIIEWYNSPLLDVDGNREGTLCIGADTTQRRSLEREIEQITQNEHQRIGQELHDGVGQELTALGIFCEHLVEKLDKIDWQSDSGNEIRAVRELAKKVATTTTTLRGSVQQLSRSMVSGDCGSDSLRTLLTNLATTTNAIPELICNFHCSDELASLDGMAALHLFRIAQESVNNAVKHSGATMIDIELDSNRRRSTLRITDDGTGLQTPSSDGVGLQVMHYRADLIGADLTLTRNSPNGTSVQCTLVHSDLESTCHE